MDVAFERLKTIIGDDLESAYQEVANVHIDLVNGPRDFSIRVFEMPDGKYFSELSHYYWGPNQGGPYISSRTETGNTIQEVVESELRKLRTYYDDKDPAGKVAWQKGYRLDEFVDAYGHDLTREEAQQRHSSK
jgi:hypothetical protein